MKELDLILSDVFAFEVNSSQLTLLSELDQWDSVTKVRLIVEIEGVLNRDLTDDEIRQIEDVDFLSKLLV
jgi:hypothetical protein